MNANGAVRIDEHLRTSQPHIYAIGDVTDRLNLTPVATAEGHALADTLFGGNPRSVSLRNVPSAVFSTPPIATVGLTEEEAAALGPVDVYVTKFTPMRHNLSGRTPKDADEAGGRSGRRRKSSARTCWARMRRRSCRASRSQS